MAIYGFDDGKHKINIQTRLEQLEAKIDQLESETAPIDKIYPVGSVYMSFNNVSPATFIGGTWQRLTDRFLVGAGNEYTVDSYGGSKSVTPSGSVSNTALTQAQLPNVRGAFKIRKWGTNSIGMMVKDPEGVCTIGQVSEAANTAADSKTTDGYIQKVTMDFGSGQSHGHGLNMSSQENRPPYQAVYMWRRTA